MNNQIIAEASIDVNEAPRQAENAQQTADGAKSLAETANNNVNNINAPEYLSPLEKLQLKVQMDNFATNYVADKDIATSEGIDFTAYGTAYQAYLAYMTPLVADMTTYSPIVRSTFNRVVTAVQNAQKAFSTATQAQYNQQIKQAQTDIDDGQTKYKALQSEAKIMESSVAGISDAADRAISSAGFASNTASAASQAATTASQAASSAVASAMSAESNASSAVSIADSTASEFGPVKQKADSAVASAMSAESNASSAVSIADSTASEFGPVKQKADSAVASAMSAESDASAAVTQATSAIADSKDAKQIAGAVSQSYKTLTDGSTMTIAELQNGLAAKLTKTDLDGYATQTWTQNKIKVTADDISGNLSSVKKTVDGQTTSINDLKADSSGFKTQFTTVNDTLGKQTTDIGTLQTDSSGFKTQFQTVNDNIGKNTTDIGTLQADSSGFKSQFTKVNNTLGKHTTDIGTLQATSKSLSANFDSLSSDNKTNQHDIGQLQASAKGFSSTLETVQTQVNNSAVGTNLLKGTSNAQDYTLSGSGWAVGSQSNNGTNVSIPCTPGASYTYSAIVKSTTYDCYPEIQFFDSSKKFIKDSVNFPSKDIGVRKITAVAPENAAFVGAHMVLNKPSDSQTVIFNSEKLEKGSLATDWCANPADNATATAVSKISQTVDGMQTDIGTLQADSSGFKTQFTTVNDTLGKQTTDIGTLQTDSSGFKAQFTTVNDTLGKHTTDIGSLQATSKGIQASINSKASSDQLTLLSDQLTNKISDLSSSTSSKFTQTSNDINGLVKKGDVVNQFNLDAGGALLDTSGSTAKIILSSNNIELDSANPVVMGSANITNLLTSKTIEASSITSSTNIIGSDIQAAMIHSTDNSFVLDGDKGSITGATITSTDNSWSISPAGKITGADVYAGGTYTYVASGSGNTVTGAIYNELNSNGYHQWTDANDHVRINNGTIGITNDAHEKANVDSVDGIPTGVLISDGQSQFTGNVSITNNLQVGNFYTNGGHTINSMDGGAVFLENGVSSGNDMVNFHAGVVFTKGLHTNNLGLNNGHTLSSADGGGIYVKDSYNGGGNYVNLHVKKLYQSSLLSLKTDIKPIDPHDALTELVKNDVMAYHYKTDPSGAQKSVSVILDDVNPIPKYYTSDIFKSDEGDSRNDGTIVGYLMLSIKDLNSRLQKLEGAN